MSHAGLKVAKTFGHTLPAFSSRGEAEAQLFRERNERLSRVEDLAVRSGGMFTADFTRESLTGLEHWYFTVFQADAFGSLGVPREEFERYMATYFCEVAVRNASGAKWVVQEYAFEPGKYEVGVGRGLISVMRSRFTDHYKVPNNKRQQKIYREYQQLFVT